MRAYCILDPIPWGEVRVNHRRGIRSKDRSRFTVGLITLLVYLCFD